MSPVKPALHVSDDCAKVIESGVPFSQVAPAADDSSVFAGVALRIVDTVESWRQKVSFLPLPSGARRQSEIKRRSTAGALSGRAVGNVSQVAELDAGFSGAVSRAPYHVSHSRLDWMGGAVSPVRLGFADALLDKVPSAPGAPSGPAGIFSFFGGKLSLSHASCFLRSCGEGRADARTSARPTSIFPFKPAKSKPPASVEVPGVAL